MSKQNISGTHQTNYEAVDYLIEKAHVEEQYYKFIYNKLEQGEKSGFARKQTREEMLAEFKKNIEII